MLTLAQASSYFDRTPILSVTGAHLFYGQVEPYQDSMRDSATAYRRVLSVAPGTVIPSSRLVKILGSIWVVGDSEVDGMSEAFREKYVLHPAPTQLLVNRLSAHVSGTTPAAAWGDMVWFKDGKEEAQSSRAVPVYSVYASLAADIREYDIIKVGAQGYLVGHPHTMASGVLSATCVHLEFAVASATLGTRTYDPVQGKYTATVTTSVPCQRIRWQSLYLFDSQASAKYQEGDCSLVLPAGTVLATKDTVTLDSVLWNVLSVDTLGGAVVAHGRLGSAA